MTHDPAPSATANACAVVTGAHGQIGAAISTRLTGRGYQVVCVVRPGRDQVAGAAETLRCDLSSSAEVEDVATALAAQASRPLVLVNCAAQVGPLKPVEEITAADWRRVLQVNFMTPVALTVALLPGMVAAGFGRVINISSAAGVAAAPRSMGPYAVSKSCLNRFTAQLAVELPPGVTAHALHPGDVASAMWQEISAQAHQDGRLTELRRWARDTADHGASAEDAADMVERLLDPGVAARENGHFLWPPGSTRPALDLASWGWPGHG